MFVFASMGLLSILSIPITIVLFASLAIRDRAMSRRQNPAMKQHYAEMKNKWLVRELELRELTSRDRGWESPK